MSTKADFKVSFPTAVNPCRYHMKSYAFTAAGLQTSLPIYSTEGSCTLMMCGFNSTMNGKFSHNERNVYHTSKLRTKLILKSDIFNIR
jgi:hypothetical protein